jgi:hypothetical protein
MPIMSLIDSCQSFQKLQEESDILLSNQSVRAMVQYFLGEGGNEAKY